MCPYPYNSAKSQYFAIGRQSESRKTKSPYLFSAFRSGMFKIVSFGPMMTKKEGEAVAELLAWKPQLVVISSLNAATSGPTAARERAKRKFLDPAEMALFNSDALRVLAACGAIRLVQEELDSSMVSIAAGQARLPTILATPEKIAFTDID